MTYSDAIQHLLDLRLFGTKLGLENPRRLAAMAGNPEKKMAFVHVAGTNGKGSVCAMLEGIYRAAGFRTGLFTSPHLVSFRERIQVNRNWISEGEVARWIGQLKEWAERFSSGSEPTFFEMVTVMALCHFVENECNIVLWETGMGGRLDATNIVTPVASVITNVELDHQEWLGETHAEIAVEKAGIIKPDVPVLTACESQDALNVIQSHATDMHSSLDLVRPENVMLELPGKIELPLHGDHQRLNAALAIATVQKLQEIFDVPVNAVAEGLENIHWPGRLQIIEQEGQTILLDCAHNAHGATILKNAIMREFDGKAPAILLGVLRQKDGVAMGRLLASIASRMILVPVNNPLSADPIQLKKKLVSSGIGIPMETATSLGEALAACENSPLVVIAGSFYLAGEALEFLEIAPVPSLPERSLNEWGKPGQVN